MAFDIIGDIAIVKPPLKMSEEEYVNYILSKHKFVKTILLQETDVQPPYRIANYKILWGNSNTETVHKEYGLKFKVDVTKAYFSPRLANERYYIAKQVKDNESVLVMFSGVNPYPIYISKFSNAKEIYSIELNPFAVKYGIENVKINKVDNVYTIMGDVKRTTKYLGFLGNNDGYIHNDEEYLLDILESNILLNKVIIELSENIGDYIRNIKSKELYIKYNRVLDLVVNKLQYDIDGLIKDDTNRYYIFNSKSKEIEVKNFYEKKFDRIIMPLPKESEMFLDVAIKSIKESGIIHLYVFMFEDEIPDKAKDILDENASKYDFEYEILNVRKVGDIGPRQYRVCIDFKVRKK